MEDIEALHAATKAAMDDGPDWEGLPGSSEHRTVGAHRAWNFATTQWCYPDALCPDCDQIQIPERWRGLNVGDVLAELKAEVDGLRYKGEEGAWNNALEAVMDRLDGNNGD